MKVFFACSFRGKKLYQEYFNQVIGTLKKNKVEVISKETNEYEDILGKKITSILTPEEMHYLFVKTGIDKSNAVIVDISRESFQLGHEATIALLYNKPVLCLSKGEISNIKVYDPRLRLESYNSKADINRIINSFLNEVRNKYLSVRLHVNLSPEHKNFLDWYGAKSGKNISQIIRDSIDTMIHENPEYTELEYRFKDLVGKDNSKD